AMRAAGTDDRTSISGSFDVGTEAVVEDGGAKWTERTAFAGSVGTTDRLERTMLAFKDIPLVESIRLLSVNPASGMRVDGHKGSIEVGKDADLIIVDEEVNVSLTMVNGRVVYGDVMVAE